MIFKEMNYNHFFVFCISDKWWDARKGPILFYTGNEGDITGFWDATGFVFELAPKFKALVIFAEHVSTFLY